MRTNGGDIWNETLVYFAEEYGRDSAQYKHMKTGAKKALNSGDDYDGLMIALSLMDAPRDASGDSWDCMVQYGFFNGADMDDDDVREYIDDNIRIRPPYSPYDCTGRPFTMYINWHRNPTGLISFVNHIGLDV